MPFWVFLYKKRNISIKYYYYYYYYSPRPKIPATWLSFISVMSLLIHGMPTAVTVWITFRLTSDRMRTRNSFVISSSSTPPTFAMVMVTFFPLRPSSSATDNLIKLTWAPESRSRFPCFLTFSDPRISTRMTGRKYLHWLPLNDSLHWRLREQLETLWSRPALFAQLKQPWFHFYGL